jgi:hypothetical protein
MSILTDYLRFAPMSHMLSKIEQTFYLKTFATGVKFVAEYNFEGVAVGGWVGDGPLLTCPHPPTYTHLHPHPSTHPPTHTLEFN